MAWMGGIAIKNSCPRHGHRIPQTGKQYIMGLTRGLAQETSTRSSSTAEILSSTVPKPSTERLQS